MKKIFAVALAALFAIPSFAFTVKLGETITYIPAKEGKVFESVVTKIAPAVNGYEMTLLSNGVSYTYALSEGEVISVYGKKTPKAKESTEMRFKVVSIKNNEVELVSAAVESTTDAK